MENTIFAKLDDNTKAICAAWFGTMTDTDYELRFGMKAARPTKQAQDALDTLVKEKIIRRTDNADGSVVYNPIEDCSVLHPWFMEVYMQKNTDLPSKLVEQIGEDPIKMVLTVKDADPRVVAMYHHFDEISKMSREQLEVFYSALEAWGFFKEKKKVDKLHHDKLRSLVIKALKKVRDTK